MITTAILGQGKHLDSNRLIMTSLPSLRKGILRHPLEDQVLVFDATQDRIHLLDETTAFVVELLERGETADGIVAKLEQRNNTEFGEELLALALDELAKADLTESKVDAPVGIPELSRRQMLSRFAGIGAAVLIPAIVSLTPSTASGQASFGCGSPCTTTAQCPGTTRATCHCCKIGGQTDGTCSTELSGNCQPV
jgi:hypothetical protein